MSQCNSPKVSCPSVIIAVSFPLFQNLDAENVAKRSPSETELFTKYYNDWKGAGKGKTKSYDAIPRFYFKVSACFMCALYTQCLNFFVVVKSYLVQFSFVRTIQKFNKKVANLKELLHAFKVIFSIRNLDDSLHNLKTFLRWWMDDNSSIDHVNV